MCVTEQSLGLAMMQVKYLPPFCTVSVDHDHEIPQLSNTLAHKRHFPQTFQAWENASQFSQIYDDSTNPAQA